MFRQFSKHARCISIQHCLRIIISHLLSFKCLFLFALVLVIYRDTQIFSESMNSNLPNSLPAPQNSKELLYLFFHPSCRYVLLLSLWTSWQWPFELIGHFQLHKEPYLILFPIYVFTYDDEVPTYLKKCDVQASSSIAFIKSCEHIPEWPFKFYGHCFPVINFVSFVWETKTNDKNSDILFIVLEILISGRTF